LISSAVALEPVSGTSRRLDVDDHGQVLEREKEQHNDHERHDEQENDQEKQCDLH
jgi:hypothetical protein